jgi:hypothetical protein
MGAPFLAGGDYQDARWEAIKQSEDCHIYFFRQANRVFVLL